MTSDQPAHAGPVYRAAAWASLAVMRAQRWQFDVEGGEHVPRSGGAVIAANHTSYWDFITVGRYPFLELGRPVRILAKESLFRAPIVGTVMRRAGHIPVRRGAGRVALGAAVDALRDGELILVMPEQTISPAFDLLDIKQGPAHMARAAGVPLIPAVSWGSHRFHTIGRLPRLRWKLPVTVRFGRAVETDNGATPRQLTDVLTDRLRELLRTAQRDYPDGTPQGAWWVPASLGGSAPTLDDARVHLEALTERWRHDRRRSRQRAASRRTRRTDV
ncbi:MAG: lysophospholipid acyltransferase family protein [Nitriliruptoraceae bacterium]